MNKLSKGVIALCCMGMLSACAGKSDKLGLVENESTKTYAEAFMPARDALRAGEFETLLEKMNASLKDKMGEDITLEEFKERLIKENSELAIVERALLTLNSGNFEHALAFFDAAEQKMEMTESEGLLSSVGSAVTKGGISALLGAEEMRDYSMRGYEKVMLLNYKALCYMLLGDRRAYNVTRKAIDKQQAEWELFRQELAELEAKQEKALAESEEAREAAQKTDKLDVDRRDASVKQKASLVSSAYVNPFGDYMNAVLWEMDGIADRSVRDNARISYKKVVENNADCSVAKTAVKQVRNGVPYGKKLVHVILADGFAPEYVEVQEAFQVDKLKAVVNYANATPVPSLVSNARVRYAGTSSKLSSLSRVESLILRDEQDRLPLRASMIGLALLRSGAAHAFLGDFGLSLAAAVQHPDTRSWLSLPNQVRVARIFVPQSTKQITLETLDAKGQRLNSTKVDIAAKGPTVVYAVSYDKVLRAYANKKSWIE